MEAADIRISTLMKRMGYQSRSTYFNHIKKEDLSLEILQKYGQVLRHDFSGDVPGMNSFALGEPDLPYITPPRNLEEAISQRDFYIKQYLMQLEHFRKLEEELRLLKAKGKE